MPLLPPNQIPAPLPPWARLLLQLLPFLPDPTQSVLDYIMELFDETAPEPTTWLRTVMITEPVGNIDPADRYSTSIDLVNITNSAIDNSWTQADFDDAVAGWNALLPGLQVLTSNQLRFIELRGYLRHFQHIVPPEDRGPDWVDEPYGKSGPPVFVVPYGVNGSNVNSRLPPQTAISHTEKTAYPRHWGRAYWPGINNTAVDASGHITSAACTALADAIEAAHDSWHADELFPVVPVVQVDNEPFRGLLTVNQIQVDNVPDVIRRRRPKSTTLRVVRP